jgi:hypothetical protein
MPDILRLKSYLLTNESIYDIRLDEGRGGIETTRGDSLLSHNLYIPTQTKTRARNALPIHKLLGKNTTPHC